MAYPIRKIGENSTPQMRIIRGDKVKNNKFGLVIIVLTILVGIVAVPIILNSISDEPANISTPTTDIDWDNPPCLPEDLSNEWQEVTDPRKQQNTEDREFKNSRTSEIIEFHPNNSNGNINPHWHRRNPFFTNRHNYYLDNKNNPVRKNSKPSHIYTNCK